MLELYTHPMSPCAQKVRIVLAEKSLDWTAHHVDLPAKQNLEPEYLALNPLGVVPTLVHDGRPVIESSIICEYLEDVFPTPSLRPADPYLGQRLRFWMKHVDNKLHPSCGALQWPMVMRDKLLQKSEAEREAILDKVPEKPRRERQKRLLKMGLDAPDVVDAVRTYRRTILDMEAALEQSAWVVGDDFSLADASLAPYFQTLFQFGWTRFYDEDCPRVTDWVSRCRERESYTTAVSDDFPPEVMEDLLARGKAGVDKLQQHLASA